jgi:hypothetical protein
MLRCSREWEEEASCLRVEGMEELEQTLGLLEGEEMIKC